MTEGCSVSGVRAPTPSSRALTVTCLLLALLLTPHHAAAHAWQKPGCHKLGFTRPVYIPGCVAFKLTANACRGYCTSYAIPSPLHTLLNNPSHVVTSRAECCAIADTHDIKVSVRCSGGYRQFTFKSAASCACSVCRHDAHLTG